MSDKSGFWSSEVTAHDRHDGKTGVFATGSAQEIAADVIGAAEAEGPEATVERRAMAKLTFYENRAGKNLSSERKAVLEQAKVIVRERA